MIKTDRICCFGFLKNFACGTLCFIQIILKSYCFSGLANAANCKINKVEEYSVPQPPANKIKMDKLALRQKGLCFAELYEWLNVTS